MDIEIRPVKVTDAKDISTCCFVTANEEEIRKQIEKDLKKIQEGNLTRLVAVSEGSVIGHCEISKKTSPVQAHIAEIYGVVVNEKNQGKGIFSKLLNAGIGWSKEKGCSLLVISVRKGTKAEEVYKHAGFKVYGELENGIVEPWGDRKSYTEVYLYKNI